MTRQQLLAGLTTLAVVCGAGSAAWADPYADEALAVARVTHGTLANGVRINTSWDNGDNGIDALGAPNREIGNSGLTVLGFDARGTSDPADDRGGMLALRFLDNVCMDGSGPDIKVHEDGNNEAAMVEVSDDGGRTFAMVGEVGPDNGFELDVDGGANRFSQIRLTAKSHAGSTNTAGLDVDAVECLHSADPSTIPPDTAEAGPDGCDLVGRNRRYSRGRRGDSRALDGGIDVKDVTVESGDLSVTVTLDLCGKLSNRTVYSVYFDYTDRTNLDDDPADDGPDTLDGNLRCRRTYDHSAYYYRGRERGGSFSRVESIDENGEENGDQLVLTVDYMDLNRGAGVTYGSEMLLWVETRGPGYIRDHVPTTEAGDRCSRPQIEKEVIRVSLGSDGGSTGGGSTGGGSTGGDPGADDDDEDDDD